METEKGREKRPQPLHRKESLGIKENRALRTRFLLVLLSEFDFKKCRPVLQFKKHLAENQDLTPEVGISKALFECDRETNEFGELQNQRISAVLTENPT